MSDQADEAAPRVQVQVWFGSHVIAEYQSDGRSAERYAEAMRRRFAGLRVTTDPVVDVAPNLDLPDEKWWRLIPQ
jgi:hypothetical protein